MKQGNRNIWTRPKEARIKVLIEMPYIQDVSVYDDQTSKVARCYHITVKISFFRYWLSLGRTLNDLKKVCADSMPEGIDFVLHIKSLPWLYKALNYTSDVYQVSVATNTPQENP